MALGTSLLSILIGIAAGCWLFSTTDAAALRAVTLTYSVSALVFAAVVTRALAESYFEEGP